MKKLSGIAVSPGIVTGKAFLYLEGEFPEIARYTIKKEQRPAEMERLDAALGEALEEVRELQRQAGQEMSREHAAILETHVLMLEDPDFQDQLRARFKETGLNMEWVVWDIARGLMEKMMASPDPLFRERAVDINDVSKQIIYKLLQVKRVSLGDLTEDVILTAKDLFPSEMITMKREHILAIVLDAGGKTSHTAILARAFGIPAVVGLSTATREISSGDTLVVDGTGGFVYVNPDRKVFADYREAAAGDKRKLAEFMGTRDLPAETTDGFRVNLQANIEIPEEAEPALKYGAGGIGLYRSEFLFISPGVAAEEERQMEAYKGVLQTMEGRPVTIRTVDIGGDKILPDFQVTKDEKNPLLGWRAIRFSLALPDLFKTQLRALLRASVHGRMRILFPLISGMEELDQVLGLLEEAKEECRRKGQAFDEEIETGVMLEVPSAVMIADILAEKANFFSLGTNDLIQYSLAVDRGNERVNYLAQPCHPAILRLLKMALEAARKAGRDIALCGEMAGDPIWTPVLLGLGLDTLSMSSRSIPQVKRIVRNVTLRECEALRDELLAGKSARENTARVQGWLTKRGLG